MTKQPLILIDWSNEDDKKRHMILRASLALEGRSLTLLQYVKSMDDYNFPHVHAAFLLRLKAQLPEECRPVIVTDAGFKFPWLKQIIKIGWPTSSEFEAIKHCNCPCSGRIVVAT